MKRATVRKLTVRTAPKVTTEERMRVELLISKREMWLARLRGTAEARHLVVANAELADFEEKIAKKYGVARPLAIDPDGTLRTQEISNEQ